MAGQLQLLEQAPDWRLDDTTRAVGQRGVAEARAALAAARRAAAAVSTAEHDPKAA